MNPEERTHTQDTHAGRIESHGRGIGAPSPQAVEIRAREIARIEGRTGADLTDDDLDRAARELHDQDLTLASDDARSDLIASSNPADMVVDTGHQVPDRRPPDEQERWEAEIKEGVREAEHERMLEGQDLDEELG